MKTNLTRMALLTVAAVTMALPAFAGQAQSEREKALRDTEPESALGWQIRPAIETGSLSEDNSRQLISEGAAGSEVPTVEYGGRLYRIGIDTP